MSVQESIREKSCGAVVFTNDSGQRKYLIIKSLNGIYGFPKGHIEINETELEAAKREIFEETGIFVDSIDGLRFTESYSFVKAGIEIEKEVVYFLCRYSEQTPVQQENEISEIYLLDYETAYSILTFDEAKEILYECENFLRQG